MRKRALFPVVAALMLAGCSTVTDVGLIPDQEAGEFQIHGIDVSKYQGNIDWQAARSSGVTFAWIKATEGGNFKDEDFDHNWQAARDAGVVRGAYHFAYWCRPAAEQVAWFNAHVPVDPTALPPVLDVEWNPTSKTCPRKLSREVALREMRIILEGMERNFGRRPVIYTSVDFYRDVLSSGDLNDYPLWVRSVKYHPTVKYGNQRWHFWQYTATGRVPGIRGEVDRNAFYGDAKTWQAFLEGPKQ